MAIINKKKERAMSSHPSDNRFLKHFRKLGTAVLITAIVFFGGI